MLTDSVPDPTELHPLIEVSRVRDSDTWDLRVQGRLKGHRVDRMTVELISAMADGRVAELEPSRFPDEDVAARIGWLRDHDYLLSGSARSTDTSASRFAEWASRGWESAGRYHFETYGYPFEKYSRGRSAVDLERMTGYTDDKPDTDRGNAYETTRISARPMSDPNDVRLPPLPDRASEDTSALLDALSMIMLPVARAQLIFPSARRVLRKTTPSGGSRHPTELYILNSGFSGLEKGVHHVDADAGVLEHLSDGSEFAGHDVPPTSRATLYFTSHLPRNRFRYREPRTFRTVHMDVGHLLTTTEMVMVEQGLSVTTHVAMDAMSVNAALRLHPLVEPVIASVVVY